MQTNQAAATAEIWRPDPDRFLDPIEYIRVEHERQQEICGLLESALASAPDDPSRADLDAVLHYVVEEMPNHILDEEEGLFPLLEERCRPDDGVRDILELLRLEHDVDRELAARVRDSLQALLDARPFGDPEGFLRDCYTFVETQCRHLAWENEVVLPIARIRLTPEDRESLGRSMATRRNIDYPD
ncbi:MAG: hemerythrin domain-containing protein [Alphaproteobacteria bacterium]|nr:hemerythrin domain-containing protein [Alphaproteobacteria bacterium]